MRQFFLKKHAPCKIPSWDEVFKHLFFFPGWNFIPLVLTAMSSSQDEVSSRWKRVNSKRHFIKNRNNLILGRVSSQYEISYVNTLLIGWVNNNQKNPRFYFNNFLYWIVDSCSFPLWESVYRWNFILRWECSQEKVHPGMDSSLSKKQGWSFIPEWKKRGVNTSSYDDI